MAKRTFKDWTVDPKTGRSNSSPEFRRLAAEVGRLIRDDAFILLCGGSEKTGLLIMAQLAHKHGLTPSPPKKRRSKK